MPIASEIQSLLDQLRSAPAANDPPDSSALTVIVDTNVLLDFWAFHDPKTEALLRLIEDGTCTMLRGSDCHLKSRPRFSLTGSESRAAPRPRRKTRLPGAAIRLIRSSLTSPQAPAAR